MFVHMLQPEHAGFYVERYMRKCTTRWGPSCDEMDSSRATAACNAMRGQLPWQLASKATACRCESKLHAARHSCGWDALCIPANRIITDLRRATCAKVLLYQCALLSLHPQIRSA